MTWTVHPSAASRHLLLRASAGELLPDGLAARLREEGVTCGWLRASGVLHDVELRAFDGDLGTLGSARRIAGPVHALSLEGSIGLSDGEPSFALRGLLARETDRGLETLAGEIASARVAALEVLVTVLEDVSVARALDPAAGVWLVGAGGSSGAPRQQPARAAAPSPSAPAAPVAWGPALAASERAEEAPRPRPAATSSAGSSAGSPAMPQRPQRPGIDLDTPSPEPGDQVDHFAFGRADVLKTDGDRLHLRVHKDGRIREIALEMLKVTRLDDDAEGKRRFRLERRI